MSTFLIPNTGFLKKLNLKMNKLTLVAEVDETVLPKVSFCSCTVAFRYFDPPQQKNKDCAYFIMK